MTAPAVRRVLAVIPDLFFATKVAATAKAGGVDLELVAQGRVVEQMSATPPTLVLIDLHAANAMELVAAIKAVAPKVPVVGFFSHVEIALRRDALAAGADAALPRSQFVNKLAMLLTHGIEALRTPAPGEIAP